MRTFQAMGQQQQQHDTHVEQKKTIQKNKCL